MGGYADGSSILEILNNFRLTMTSGVAITTSDVTYAAAQTLYCTPFNGNRISLYDGANWKIYQSGEFSLALGTLTNKSMYDIFCYANAGVPTLEFLVWTNTTTRATALVLQNGVYVKSGDATRLYIGTFYNPGNQSATVTMTIAAPGVITYTAHGLTANAPVVFTNSGGALPTGIVSGTTYYVCSTAVSAMTANTFQISAAPGGAPITTSGSQSGTHTCTVPTYTEDSQANRFLWNYYNRAPRKMFRSDSATSWTYTTAVTRQSNASLLNQLNFIIGISDTPVSCVFVNQGVNTLAGTGFTSWVGLDSITTGYDTKLARYPCFQAAVAATVVVNVMSPQFYDYTGIGLHYLSMLEISTAAGTTTWNGTVSGIMGTLQG